MFGNSLFAWLRKAVAAAFVAGIADGLSTVTGRTVDPADALRRLEYDPEAADDLDVDDVPPVNGRRKAARR